MKKSSKSAYLMRVSLAEIRPEIWRTILVPDDYTLGYLHVILQTVMDWLDYHLHQFEIGGKVYGRPDYDEAPEGLLDERKVKLGEILSAARKPLSYQYDFGDGWGVSIGVEQVMPLDPEVMYPQCVDGRRAAPPEDVGGPPGYENFLEAIRDPAHEQHQELTEWIGGEFDPEEFDLDYVNMELRKIFRLLD